MRRRGVGHRAVSDAEREQYERDGVVALRGILDADWLELLRAGLREVFTDQWNTGGAVRRHGCGPAGGRRRRRHPERRTGPGHGGPRSIPHGHLVVDLQRHDSPGGTRVATRLLAGQLFGADKVNYYDDQVLLKEPGAREYTAFHTDEPYYHLSGLQVCGMWVSPDPVGVDNSPMRYVRGSHRWGTFFQPNSFVSQMPTYEGEGLVRVPDIEGNEDAYDIVTITSDPGDVIVHHSNLIHGSKPNYGATTPRWAASFRYAGDDVRYRFHPSAPPQPHHHHDLREGDVIDCDQFPVVWRRNVNEEVGFHA
ncbi:MAG: phytanoyl-CoA dioxygenase family protein [Acidimicrobiales bacterium]